MDRPHTPERPGRWDAWLDPSVPLRVAVEGGDPARVGVLARWAEAVPLEGSEAAALDGLLLPARGPTGRFPHVPALAADDIADPRRREGFAEAVFARNRWRAFVAAGADRGTLVDFHAAHELLLRSHDEPGMQRLDALVGGPQSEDFEEVCAAYEAQLAASFGKSVTPDSQANVLRHALGYLERELDAEGRRALLAAIDAFRAGEIPLAEPVSMLRERTLRHRAAYLARQLWFDPIPEELSTRDVPPEPGEREPDDEATRAPDGRRAD